MPNLKQAMKIAKETGKRTKVTEPTAVDSVKVNTSIRLDLEVLNWFKTEAEKKGMGYQTLINSVLVQHTRQGSIEDRMADFDKRLRKVGG
ncbi:BrnA antitoxin family protein [Bdellovibrio sp. HCB288]|uniref:BrnA antitoxin family protein n=1 Tax=Bdellovibrio sp. HCB288 TaxID=3394355 RepID=UPI0039B65399